jgi:hypothetical protein
LGYEGRAIEKVIVEGHPELTEAIDKILWDAIQMYSEDNYQDLVRDLRDAYDERDLWWNVVTISLLMIRYCSPLQEGGKAAP